jgi:hypothetical protein
VRLLSPAPLKSWKKWNQPGKCAITQTHVCQTCGVDQSIFKSYNYLIKT